MKRSDPCNLDVRVLFQFFNLIREHFPGHVDITLFHLKTSAGGFNDFFYDHALYFGRVDKVFRIGVQNDPIVFLPFVQDKGSGAGGIAGQPRHSPVTVGIFIGFLLMLLDHLGIHDAGDASRKAREENSLGILFI